MPGAFTFDHHLDFSPENAEVLLRQIPAAPGVLSLRGETGEPYLTRSADLRRRARRILAPPEALNQAGEPVLSKRLNLRDRVRFIDFTRTGSDFESALILYRATRASFGPEAARKRLRLYPPYFLRVTTQHAHPRVYSTNRLSKKSLAETFGPFPSRAAAERYCDAVLDLFKLRRCHEDLVPHPDHPGCAYGEMNKCLAPCKQSCTPEDYASEAERILAFFRTRGDSMLAEIAQQREAASEAMDFEAAATLHKHHEKVRAATLLADELIRPVPELRALILQPAAPDEINDPIHQQAAAFLLNNGTLAGPVGLSTLGVRAVREQTAVGSSLFAQPLMLAAVPLSEPAATSLSEPPHNIVILSEGDSQSEAPQSKDPEAVPPPTTAKTSSSSTEPATTTPEDRARQTLTTLDSLTTQTPDIPELCDHLSLFRRWYYRPEKQRTGEVFLPNPDGAWPIRRVLNGAARIVLGPPAPVAPVDREAAKTLKTKIIHEGREGVEREVPILPPRPRTRRKASQTESQEQPS